MEINKLLLMQQIKENFMNQKSMILMNILLGLKTEEKNSLKNQKNQKLKDAIPIMFSLDNSKKQLMPLKSPDYLETNSFHSQVKKKLNHQLICLHSTMLSQKLKPFLTYSVKKLYKNSLNQKKNKAGLITTEMVLMFLHSKQEPMLEI